MSEGEASFNMSVPTLQRMDLLLQKISVYALSKDLEMWRDCLAHLRRETACYIKAKQFDKITELLKSLNSFEWVIIDEQGRKKYIEKEVVKVTDILDDTTILMEKAMFDGGILMAKTSKEGGYD